MADTSTPDPTPAADVVDDVGPAAITPVVTAAAGKARGLGLVGPLVVFALAVVLPFVYDSLPFVGDDSSFLRTLSLGFVLAISAMGLNVLTGFTGQISIGHAAFYGIGAYLSGMLTDETALTYFSTIPIAVAVTVVFGAVVGLPALRVKGPALALVTLGLALVVPTLLRKFAAEGRSALWQPSRDDLASPIDALDSTQWKYLFPLIVLAVVYVLVRNLAHSRAGRAMVAVRDHEVSASTAGVNVAGTKIAAFAISAGFCGLAGSLSVVVRGQADASSSLAFFQLSIYFLVAVVVGGVATNGGPILGAIVVQILLDEAPEGRAGLAPFVLGAALVALLFVMPDGLFGGARRLVAWVRRQQSASPSPAPPPNPHPEETP